MGLGCMKRVIVTAFFIFICFLLQCTVFRALAFGGIVPNLLIVLTASFGFMRGEKTGLLIGFFSGLLVDIFFGSVIGFYALLYMYIGYANGKFSAIFYPEDIKLPITLILCSDFAYGIICYMILFCAYYPARNSLYGRRDFVFVPCDPAGEPQFRAERKERREKVCLKIFGNI